MSVFRRRRRDEGDNDEQQDTGQPTDELLRDEDSDGDATDQLDDDQDEYDDAAADRAATPRAREVGPWDIADVPDPAAAGRIDLGGLWIPGAEGLEIRVEADNTTGQVIAVTLVLRDGALQLQPFAAPRSEGIWDEVRSEIRAGITAQGGTSDEVEGPVGPELRTKVPVRAADGASGVQPARFIGVDGPRWFLRAVITGRPAVEPDAGEELIALFREVVVVRGSAPMAPREPIPLTLPSEPDEAQDSADGDQPDLNPFARGPEITEIR
ncbi:MAG: hypothetical protein QOH75_2089 [Actinomycetota bacterium]|nr:hypothetical protein [Actinomycetota bacterium]MDQ1671339.1 hypothetical protein [Actinomycetota bacterium]